VQNIGIIPNYIAQKTEVATDDQICKLKLEKLKCKWQEFRYRQELQEATLYQNGTGLFVKFKILN
jgi:hypothetical protein